MTDRVPSEVPRKKPDEGVICPTCLFYATRHHTEATFHCENCGWDGTSKLTPMRILRNL